MPQKRENDIIEAKSDLYSSLSNNRQRFHGWNHHHPWHNSESVNNNNEDDLDKEVTVTSVGERIKDEEYIYF